MRLPRIPRALLPLTIVAVLLASVPAGAAQPAERCEAPPGTSGADQYCETLPAGGGDRQSTGRSGAGGSYDGATRRKLERSGEDGRGVLAVPAADGGAKAPARERPTSRPDAPGAPIGSLGSALESGPGAGEGFIWLLLAAGLGMAAVAWWRWRRGAGA